MRMNVIVFLLISILSSMGVKCKRIGSVLLFNAIGTEKNDVVEPFIVEKIEDSFDNEANIGTESAFLLQIESIKSSFFNEFKNRIAPTNSIPTTLTCCNQQKILILTECRAIIKGIVPDSAPIHWSIEDPIKDLENEIDLLVANIQFEDADNETEVIAIEANPYLRKLKTFFLTKTGKRVRWFIAQSILLLVSYAQNEVRQYVARRAVDRRLAEIPEFPLL